MLCALSLTLVACPVSAQTCAADWLERRAPSSIGDAAMAQAIFVHRGNPLARLTMAQLAAVFGSQPSITRWGSSA